MKLTLKCIIFSFSALILFGCAVKTTKNVINIVGQIGSIDEYGNVVLDKKSSAQAKAYLELGDSLNIHFGEDSEKLICKMVKDYGVWGVKKFMGREYTGLIRTTFISLQFY